MKIKYSEVSKRFEAFLLGDDGATAVEYALMAAAIAGVIVAVIMAIGVKVKNNFESFNLPSGDGG